MPASSLHGPRESQPVYDSSDCRPALLLRVSRICRLIAISHSVPRGPAVTVSRNLPRMTFSRNARQVSVSRVAAFAPGTWDVPCVSPRRKDPELSDATRVRVAPATTGMNQTGCFDCSLWCDCDAGSQWDGRNRSYMTIVMTGLFAPSDTFRQTPAGGAAEPGG